MTLQDRLAAAKAERRRAAGLPEEDLPSDIVAPELPRYERHVVPEIDLTGVRPVVDLRTAPAPDEGHRSLTGALSVSQSSACPACSTEGRLDMQDIAGGVDHYTCPNCNLLFQVAR